MKGFQQMMVGFCVALDERSVWGVGARRGGEGLQKVEGGVEGRERARGRSRAGCPFSHMGPASTTPGPSLARARPRDGRPARVRGHLCAVPSMPEGHRLKLSGRKHQDLSGAFGLFCSVSLYLSFVFFSLIVPLLSFCVVVYSAPSQ